jgi:hypothetical protein
MERSWRDPRFFLKQQVAVATGVIASCRALCSFEQHTARSQSTLGTRSGSLPHVAEWALGPPVRHGGGMEKV